MSANVEPRAWCVYLLRCADGTLYAGATSDVERRVKQHGAGKGAAYTRARLPVELAYVEPAADRSAALRREAALKKLTRAQKLALVAAGGVWSARAMTEFVAFLGGINVGGHRVSMDRLKAEFEAIRLERVWTFIASGNVGFASALGATELEGRIAAHLASALGYAVPTFVRSAAEVVDAASCTPFACGTDETHLVGFLHAPPSAAARRATEALSNDTDLLVIRGAELHWRIRGKVTDSSIKPGVLAKALGQPTTTRNTKSLRKLAGKLAGYSAAAK